MITLIAAVGRNREIGFKNKLLWNIPEDMQHFRGYTMGKTLVMGRKTFASIGNRPLPGRRCVVVSSADLGGLGVIPAKSIEQALSIEHCYSELVVIGGESIYRQTINLADRLVITHIDADFEADTFFPEIDLAQWNITTQKSSSDTNYQYLFAEYERKK